MNTWPEWISGEDNNGRTPKIKWVESYKGVDIYQLDSANGEEYWFEIDIEEFERQTFASLEDAKQGMINHLESLLF